MQGQKSNCDLVRLLPSSADECTFVKENCESGTVYLENFVASFEVTLALSHSSIKVSQLSLQY